MQFPCCFSIGFHVWGLRRHSVGCSLVEATACLQAAHVCVVCSCRPLLCLVCLLTRVLSCFLVCGTCAETRMLCVQRPTPAVIC